MLLKIIRYFLFFSATVFLILTFIGLVIVELFSLEFQNEKLSSRLIWVFLILLPFAILLTLAGTIKKRNSSNRNWIITAVTIVTSLTTFIIMLFLTINSVGEWINVSIIYRNKLDRTISINEQIYDVGTLGIDHKSRRFVQVKPILKYFYQVTLIDTTKINKDLWTAVNESSGSYDN